MMVETRLRKLRRFCVKQAPEDAFPFGDHHILYMSQDLFDRWMWEVCQGNHEREWEMRQLAKTGAALNFESLEVVVTPELPPDTAMYWRRKK